MERNVGTSSKEVGTVLADRGKVCCGGVRVMLDGVISKMGRC